MKHLEASLKELTLKKPILNFLTLILKKKRSHLLTELAARVAEERDNIENVSRITIETPIETPDTQQNNFEKYVKNLSNKTVVSTFEVNPDIIAGFKITHGNHIYDGTLNQSLVTFKNKILSKS